MKKNLQFLFGLVGLLALLVPQLLRASYQTEVLADSPVVYLRHGDNAANTTAADTSGNSHTGTYSTNSNGITATGLLTSDADTAINYAGTQTCSLGNPAALQITGNITIECWVSFGTLPSNSQQAMLVSKGYDGAHQGYYLRVYNNSGTYELHVGSYTLSGNIDAKAVATIAWSTGQTHYVVGRYNGTAWQLLVDGAQVASTTIATGAVGSTTNVIVAGEDQGSSPVNKATATIDEVAIYNTSLSDARVTAHSQAGTNTSPATFTSAVATDGTKVNLTFSASVTGVSSSDYWVESGGKPQRLTTATGSGTTWSLPLDRNFIYTGATTKTTYFGTGTVTSVGSLPTAAVMSSTTNSSTVVARQSDYLGRGFGSFIHISAATGGQATGYVSLGTINAIDFSGTLNPTQWVSTVTSGGGVYACMTTKHDASLCFWPTATAAYSIAQTAYGVAHPGANPVRDFVRACHAAGIRCGLYINFYDPKWLHDHTNYATGGYLAYIEAQISEILSYGQVDFLWIDSWNYASGGDTVGYTTVPYSTILTYVHAIWPNCVVLNNEHTGDLSHSEIAVYEDQVQSEPLSTNALPAEWCETILSDNTWTWSSGSGDTLKDPLVLLARYNRLQARRCNYLLNITPNTAGVIPASQVAWMADFGAKVGTQGGAVFPVQANVRSGVDRGDGWIGTNGGGINGTAILGF